MFGGSTLTTTDVIVAAGRADIGDHHKIAAHLDKGLIARTEAKIADMLETAVERSRLSPEPLPVIVVGGGSILVEDKVGGLEVVKPHHFAVANAVGAAIAQVSRRGRSGLFARPPSAGRTRSRTPGRKRPPSPSPPARARKRSKIVDVEDVPLAYLPGNATRVRVKVVGELHVA